MKASWNTESPNWERNWAVHRNAIGAVLLAPFAGARRGPALVASGPLVLSGLSDRSYAFCATAFCWNSGALCSKSHTIGGSTPNWRMNA